MITYKLATIDDLEYLVSLRILELEMFRDTPFPKEFEKNIYDFYEQGFTNNTCFTILGYDAETLVCTGSIYVYSMLPSNNNPSGKAAHITNIWTKEEYRGKGLATAIMKQLLEIVKPTCGMVLLNTSDAGKKVYEKLGFQYNDRAMYYIFNEKN